MEVLPFQLLHYVWTYLDSFSIWTLFEPLFWATHNILPGSFKQQMGMHYSKRQWCAPWKGQQESEKMSWCFRVIAKTATQFWGASALQPQPWTSPIPRNSNMPPPTSMSHTRAIYRLKVVVTWSPPPFSFPESCEAGPSHRAISSHSHQPEEKEVLPLSPRRAILGLEAGFQGHERAAHGSTLLPRPSVQARLWDLAAQGRGGWQLSVKRQRIYSRSSLPLCLVSSLIFYTFGTLHWMYTDNQ